MNNKKFPKMRELRSDELIEALVNKYPYILDNCIEVFVPEAWYPLVLETISKIESKYKEVNVSINDYFKITQIKEKFGHLIIYIDIAKNHKLTPEICENIRKIIDEAEIKSIKMCAVCGSEECDLTGSGNSYILKCPNCQD